MAEKKPKGWFSREHETPAAHREASERYRAQHGRVARQNNATLRQLHREARTSELQVEALDERLGAGKGAKRERARLAK